MRWQCACPLHKLRVKQKVQWQWRFRFLHIEAVRLQSCMQSLKLPDIRAACACLQEVAQHADSSMQPTPCQQAVNERHVHALQVAGVSACSTATFSRWNSRRFQVLVSRCRSPGWPA